MSHSSGAVRFPCGKILFFEYNGTVDVCLPHLYETREELGANWRRRDWKFCKDRSHQHERVEIVSTYGGGFEWVGGACRTCMVLTDNLSPHGNDETIDVEYSDGIPRWFPDLALYLLPGDKGK